MPIAAPVDSPVDSAVAAGGREDADEDPDDDRGKGGDEVGKVDVEESGVDDCLDDGTEEDVVAGFVC